MGVLEEDGVRDIAEAAKYVEVVPEEYGLPEEDGAGVPSEDT